MSFKHSTVCSLTPSSPATISSTMSVALAPRFRIAVKAAWPGVSMNVITLSLPSFTLNAEIACVIPPASCAATEDWRSRSKSVVFPWSTWPITAITGGRAGRSWGEVSMLVGWRLKRLFTWTSMSRSIARSSIASVETRSSFERSGDSGSGS